MENEEDKTSWLGRALSAALVIVFGWGALWSGNYGLHLALNGANPNVDFTRLTANIADAFNDTSPSPSNSPSSVPIPAINSPIPDRSQTLKIIVGGDVMFDRAIRTLGRNNGYDSLFSAISPLFKQADIVAVNLEGPVTSNPSKTLLPDGKYSGQLAFTFATKTPAAMAAAGITLVSLANNHTDNFGRDGLAETRKRLTNSNVQWFGDPENLIGNEKVMTKNDIAVAFIGYHAFHDGFENILAEVKKHSDLGEFVIVMPHWGEEYSTTASAQMKNQARQLVAAGAKAIIGSHPHVIEERVMMGDVPVFYSLGNLLFDQYFSPGVMKGNVVQLVLTKDQKGTSISDIKIYDTSTSSKDGVTYNDQPMDF